jgi:hypothetical protein
MEFKKGREKENSIYHAPLVIFQRYKIIVLSNCDIVLGSIVCVSPINSYKLISCLI